MLFLFHLPYWHNLNLDSVSFEGLSLGESDFFITEYFIVNMLIPTLGCKDTTFPSKKEGNRQLFPF